MCGSFWSLPSTYLEISTQPAVPPTAHPPFPTFPLSSQAGRLLAALVSSLEGASPSGGEDGGDEGGEEEFGGYSAAYARLHNAHK